MKSITEIEKILLSKLSQSLNNIDPNVSLDYYNDVLVDTSYVLAALLEKLLKREIKDWSCLEWIDDCLITKVDFSGHKLSIWGIMIWGKDNTTEQWTDPFYFELAHKDNITDYVSYKFHYKDIKQVEIIYDQFKHNRGFWDKQYYSNENWNPIERNWKYIIRVSQ